MSTRLNRTQPCALVPFRVAIGFLSARHGAHRSSSYSAARLEHGGEAAAVFCWAFLLLVSTGPGAMVPGPMRSSRAGVQQDTGPRSEKAPSVPARPAGGAGRSSARRAGHRPVRELCYTAHPG